MEEIYSKKLSPPREIHREKYGGFEFKIFTLGSHPTAYILIPKGHFLYGVNYDNIPLDVHGGLTYAKENDGLYWIGWDYNHLGDYNSYLGYGIKWTKEEIIAECKKVIYQFSNLKKFYYANEKEKWRH